RYCAGVRAACLRDAGLGMSTILPIVFDNLEFRPMGRPVIDGLSARISTMGATAIIGPNGAGKSVTLRLLDGLLKPHGGTIRYGDRAPSHVRRAFVFQHP